MLLNAHANTEPYLYGYDDMTSQAEISQNMAKVIQAVTGLEVTVGDDSAQLTIKAEYLPSEAAKVLIEDYLGDSGVFPALRLQAERGADGNIVATVGEREATAFYARVIENLDLEKRNGEPTIKDALDAVVAIAGERRPTLAHYEAFLDFPGIGEQLANIQSRHFIPFQPVEALVAKVMKDFPVEDLIDTLQEHLPQLDAQIAEESDQQTRGHMELSRSQRHTALEMLSAIRTMQFFEGSTSVELSQADMALTGDRLRFISDGQRQNVGTVAQLVETYLTNTGSGQAEEKAEIEAKVSWLRSALTGITEQMHHKAREIEAVQETTVRA